MPGRPNQPRMGAKDRHAAEPPSSRRRGTPVIGGAVRRAVAASHAVPAEALFWGTLALVVFAAALWLTRAIVYTYSGPARLYALELTGDASAQGAPQRLTITPHGRNATLTAYVTADVRTLAVSALEAGGTGLMQMEGCTYRAPRSPAPAAVREMRSPALSFAQERLFDFSAVPYLTAVAAVRPVVTCEALPGAVVFSTDTMRVIDVGWLATSAEPAVEHAMGQELDFRVEVNAADASDMRVTDLDLGNQMLATSFLLGPHHSGRYRVSWTSVVGAEYRDIDLVIIGALVAVGMASVIEAVRPALARFVRR